MGLQVYILSVLAFILAMGWAHFAARILSFRLASAGERWGVVAEVNSRSSHSRPTSRLGGIAILAGFLPAVLGLWTAVWVLPHSERSWGGNPELALQLVAGALALFLLGLADDLWDLPALPKLLGQMAAVAGAVLGADLRFLTLRFPEIPGLSPAAVSAGAAVVWVLFFVNVFNFMDGMDGFAARFVMNASAWLSVAIWIKAAALTGDAMAIRLEFFALPLLGAAAAGFYKANRPPARIFMGDGGSLPLGFLLALIPILADGEYLLARPSVPRGGPTVPAGAALLLFLPFLFDATLTLIRRASRGENLLAAHRSHLYQRLMIAGMSHGEVLALNLRYFQICGALAAAYLFFPAPWVRAAAWAAGLTAMIHYWLGVLRRERRRAEVGGQTGPPEA